MYVHTCSEFPVTGVMTQSPNNPGRRSSDEQQSGTTGTSSSKGTPNKREGLQEGHGARCSDRGGNHSGSPQGHGSGTHQGVPSVSIGPSAVAPERYSLTPCDYPAPTRQLCPPPKIPTSTSAPSQAVKSSGILPTYLCIYMTELTLINTFSTKGIVTIII